ncbi:hypothetical protein MKZ20_17675 [Psychrobacillus sp. FSL K6-2684]|uniref:hypothetical protein n=1 Tax=Psychrobacillus sp. FSL K6-2684 TaxID=2921547 RepID=UPI0030F93032
MGTYNNLFIICDNCNSPVVISESMEKSALAKATAIHCQYCQYENDDLEGLKEYAKHSREFANN